MTGSLPIPSAALGHSFGPPEPGAGAPPDVRELLLVSTGMVSIPPINGGAVEAYVADLARIFAARPDYHVSVISNHRAPVTRGWDGGTRWVPTHSPIDSFPLRPAPSALAHAIGGSITAAVAYRHLDRIGAGPGTLVHLNEEVSAMAFAHLKRRLGRVFTVHNPPPATGAKSYGGLEYALRQANARATWRFALRQMEAVVALTPWIRRFLVDDWRLEEGRVHVLPLPVDVAAFSPPPSPPVAGDGAPARLLFVGRLEARKNVLEAVEALRHLPSSTRLTVVGDGPLVRVTWERARSIGVERRLEVHQRIPVEGLVRLYRSHTALLHPSHLEAYPRVVVEAAACGLPSILPECGMYASFLEGGCGTGYPADGGPLALAEAVRALLDSPVRLAAARAAAREYALRSNSYAAFGTALARVYDAAVP